MSLNISLSLLASDHGALTKETKRCEKWGVDSFHLDVMDYSYAGDTGFLYRSAAAVRKATDKPLHVHFMVRQAMPYLKQFVEIAPESITFQMEAAEDWEECIDYAHSQGVKTGLAIEPDTPVERIAEYLDRMDAVVVMSVVPGKAGSPFDTRATEKVAELRRLKPELDITVDGGVTAERALQVLQSGGDSVVIGTALFRAEDPEQLIRDIKTQCREE